MKSIFSLKKIETIALYFFLFFIFWFWPSIVYADKLSITDQQAILIGKQIYMNECSGKNENLVIWDRHEEFPSLGIGHFIWYPEGESEPFKESFPALLNFMKSKGMKIPQWILSQPNLKAPWESREEFLMDYHSERMKILREFMEKTTHIQILFMVNRLETALPRILASAPKSHRDEISDKFYKLAEAKNGLYTLVDYVNFKGEGTLKTARYKNEGWGLLQVLEEIRINKENADAIREFIRAAEVVLERRIHNSPRKRHEDRWLPGWKNRLQTYQSLN